MQALIDLAQRAMNLEKQIHVLLNAVLANKELQEKILDLNRLGQLYNQGINSEGRNLSEVGGNYSPYTLQISEEKGRPKRSADHINLFDTGEFYESFYITLGDTEFYIDADPIKGNDNLFVEWGEEILGLTPESIEVLTLWIREALIPKIREYLLGGT